MQILSGLILLAVLIVFHELGHFLFAKMLGVRVLVFSLGFGPKVWGFKHGETEYRLSAIPLGGYVRMFGESLEEELSPEQKKMSFIHQPIWRKSLIAFAGPMFNFILPVILFFALALGVEQVYSPIVGTLLKDGIAEKAGLLPDDRIKAIDQEPVESFGELAQIIANNPGKELMLSIERPTGEGEFERLTIPVVPEAKALSGPLDKGKMFGRIGIMPAIEMPIVVVDRESAFYAAGLRDLDQISTVNTTKITSMSALQHALSHTEFPAQITITRQDQSEPLVLTVSASKNAAADIKPQISIHQEAGEELSFNQELVANTAALLAGEALWFKSHGITSAKGTISEVIDNSTAQKLGLQKGDRIVSINAEKISSDVQLQQSLLGDTKAVHALGVLTHDNNAVVHVFKLASNVEANLKLDADLKSVFGISTVQIFKPGEAFERHVSVPEAFKRAVSQSYAIAAMTGKSLWLMVSGEVSASQVGGPIMIFDVAQQAAQKGLAYYIFIMCLLSVNLGLLNLLPIPALDGGHLLLFGIEAVQQKPLTPKTRAIATQIGFALLLGLMGLAIFNDLYRLFT